MTIRCNTGMFIRHAEDESMVWCPRTGGCTEMRNAQPIIEEIVREWRSVEEVVRAVATKFDCSRRRVFRGCDGRKLQEILESVNLRKPRGECRCWRK